MTTRRQDLGDAVALESMGAAAAARVPLSGGWTYSAIGIVACTLADMTHEVLGHVTVARLLHVRITLLATVGMQTIGASRLVSAAGTTANLLFGALALVLFNRMRRRTSPALFLWLFAAFNLMNSAYFVFSALSRSGDWNAVISGLHPLWAWRCSLGLIGVVLYSGSLRWLSRSAGRLVQLGELALSELRRLVLFAYLAGGAIMTLASVFNPFSPKLILISGVGASYVISAGLLFIPRMVARRVATAAEIRLPESSSGPFPSNAFWVGAAIVVGIIFVAVFGPGIHFQH